MITDEARASTTYAYQPCSKTNEPNFGTTWGAHAPPEHRSPTKPRSVWRFSDKQSCCAAVKTADCCLLRILQVNYNREKERDRESETARRGRKKTAPAKVKSFDRCFCCRRPCATTILVPSNACPTRSSKRSSSSGGLRRFPWAKPPGGLRLGKFTHPLATHFPPASAPQPQIWFPRLG